MGAVKRAATGLRRVNRQHREKRCPACDGYGCLAFSRANHCPLCKGSGDEPEGVNLAAVEAWAVTVRDENGHVQMARYFNTEAAAVAAADMLEAVRPGDCWWNVRRSMLSSRDVANVIRAAIGRVPYAE